VEQASALVGGQVEIGQIGDVGDVFSVTFIWTRALKGLIKTQTFGIAEAMP